jgi:hypothetical protein
MAELPPYIFAFCFLLLLLLFSERLDAVICHVPTLFCFLAKGHNPHDHLLIRFVSLAAVYAVG